MTAVTRQSSMMDSQPATPDRPENPMLLNFALFTLTGGTNRTGVKPQARPYDAERLADMQSVLAALADLETEYEIEREQIAQGSGSEAMKQQLLADLEDRHQARRAAYQEHWVKLNSGSRPPKATSVERRHQLRRDQGCHETG